MPQLCTLADVELLLSEHGVESFADHDQDGIADDGVTDPCVDYGNSYVFGAVAQRYTATLAATSPVLKEAACVIAGRRLTLRRGNAPPASLEVSYQEFVGEGGILQRIAEGKLRISDETGTVIPMKSGSAPSFANLRVDRIYRDEKIRVVPGNSDMPNSRLERDIAREWYNHE